MVAVPPAASVQVPDVVDKSGCVATNVQVVGAVEKPVPVITNGVATDGIAAEPAGMTVGAIVVTTG